MKVIAEVDLCQGHKNCQFEAPSVFGFDEENDVVVLLDEHPPESERQNVERAVKYCPAFALSMED